MLVIINHLHRSLSQSWIYSRFFQMSNMWSVGVDSIRIKEYTITGIPPSYFPHILFYPPSGSSNQFSDLILTTSLAQLLFSHNQLSSLRKHILFIDARNSGWYADEQPEIWFKGDDNYWGDENVLIVFLVMAGLNIIMSSLKQHIVVWYS